MAYKPTAVRERQQFILEGILQILKHNDDNDVQKLLSLIRSDSRPQDIATCLRQNLQTLQVNGHIPDLVVDETDLVSLGLQGLFSHRAGKNGIKALDDTTLHQAGHVGHYSQSPIWNVLQSNDDDRNLVDETSTFDSSSSSEGMTIAFESNLMKSESSSSYGTTNTSIDFSFNTQPIVNHEAFVTALPYSGTFSPASPSGSQFAQGHHHWHSTAPEPMLRAQPFPGTSIGVDSIIRIPIEQPRTPLDILTLQFRDDCRRMLAAGATYEQLTNGGRVDCELLFRDRQAHDGWNIPGWACEVSRLFPPMLPETRLAAALCVTRFMSFLIHPCQKTLSSLPGVLRPTEFQTRIPHDVSINFIPIPMLRNCLLHKSGSCLNLLGSFGYRVDWKGDWGDVGGATLASTGRWQYEQGGFAIDRARWSQDANSGAKMKAVILDPMTGRRHISAEFEKCCWNFDNWSVKRDILKIWPDLAGHIRLV